MMLDFQQLNRVTLPAQPEADLKWETLYIDTQKPILWELLLELQTHCRQPWSRAALQAAVTHFTSYFYPQYQDKTHGVVLYKGALEEELFDPLQDLAQKFSEDTALYLLFDVGHLSLVEALTLLKHEWFRYLFVAVRSLPVDIWLPCWNEEGIVGTVTTRMGICWPETADLETQEKILAEIQKYPEVKVKIILEEYLTEQWEGIETLVVHGPSLTPRGRRQLLGFIASGGNVIVVEGAVGLPEEQVASSWEEAIHKTSFVTKGSSILRFF